MSEHFIEKCSCGKVLSQCRCMATDKTVTVKQDECPECRAKASKAIAKVTRLEVDIMGASSK